MPAIGFEVGGERFSYELSYQLAQQDGLWEGFPPSALRALEEHRVDGYWLSPSAAGGCPRQRILQIQEDYYIPLEKQWTALVGRAIHTTLAHHAEGESVEQTLSCALPVTLRSGETIQSELRGTPDYLEGGRLYDYKTVTTWRNTFPEEHHIIQLQLYYYLCARNGIDINELVLWYIRQSTSKGEARRLAVRIEPWDLQDIETIAEELAEPLAWFQHTGELPNLVYNPRWWVCMVCPVKEACLRYAEQGR